MLSLIDSYRKLESITIFYLQKFNFLLIFFRPSKTKMCYSIVAVKSYITHARGADLGAMTLGTITLSLMPSAIMPSAVMPSAVMPSAVMPNAVMPSAVWLIVVAPQFLTDTF